MDRFRIITSILVVWCSIAFSHATAEQLPAHRPGELLIQFRPQSRATALRAAENNHGIRPLRSLGYGRIQQLRLPEEMSVEQALAIYQNDPDIEFAEPNYLVAPQAIPNDTNFNSQWGLNNVGQAVAGYVGTTGADIDAVRAWDLTSGDDTVVVAVVDTGSHLTHPDLTANLWTNDHEIPGNGIDDDGNGYVDDIHGWDFVDDDNTPQDVTGHGSHVAGTIGAQRDNAMGVAGIANRVRIMPLRFMNAFDQGTVADAIVAIQYAVANGARIINCSWGSSGYSVSLSSVMANADALFVCAAGNNANDNDQSGFYPASYRLDNVLSVAASDQMDRLAWFSNIGGRSVHLAAPGVRILSLDVQQQSIWSDNFSDGALDGWLTGGTPDLWTVKEAAQYANTTTLAVTPDSSYTTNADTWAATPELNLSGRFGATLTFQIIGASEASRDYLYVEASTDGNQWRNQPVKVGATIQYSGISGAIPYWTSAMVDLGGWDDADQLRIRFRFTSNGSVEHTGFFIDALSLSTATADEAYQYMSGTSMAAAVVSGVAALVQSQSLAWENSTLKDILIDSSDLNAEFADITIGGGRINAYNALTLLSDLSLSASSVGTDRVHLSLIAQSPLDDPVAVERRVEGELEFHEIAQIGANATSYTDETVQPDTTYYYRIQAQTQDGRSGYSNQSLATTTLSSNNDGGGGGGGGCFIDQLKN